MSHSESQSAGLPPGYSDRLYNADLAPAKERKWGIYSIFSMWMQDIHSITVYTFAASLFFMGLNGYQVFAALIVSIIIIWLLMNLTGLAGQQTGTPFPVLARASFGIWGANIPALIRALMGIIYYGILTFLGSVGIKIAVLRFIPSTEALTHHNWLGLDALGYICFAAMWILQLVVVRHGMETVRKFQDWAGPAIWIVMFALAAWMFVRAGGNVSFTLSAGGGERHGGVWFLFASAIALNVSFFSTLLLNFSDFGRLAPNKRTIWVGNFLGLPVNFTAFAVVAVTVTSGTIAVYGEAITEPVELVGRLDSPTLTLIGCLTFIVATIGINIVADFISCAFDLANVAPKRVTFLKGGIIAASLSVFFLPWHLYDSPESIEGFVSALGAFLGPLFGILVVDYWLVRKANIAVDDLYTERKDGQYYYWKGFNPRAIAACGPATIASALVAMHPAFVDYRAFSWTVGAAAAAVIYFCVASRPGGATSLHAKQEPLAAVGDSESLAGSTRKPSSLQPEGIHP